MIADQEVIPSLGKPGRLVRSQNPLSPSHSRCAGQLPHFGHQMPDQADLVAIAVGVGPHGHRQSGVSSGHQGPTAQHTAAAPHTL